MHVGFNPYANDDGTRVCHFCVSFAGYRSGGTWCDRFKLLCANGVGCAFFERAPLADGQAPALPP